MYHHLSGLQETEDPKSKIDDPFFSKAAEIISFFSDLILAVEMKWTLKQDIELADMFTGKWKTNTQDERCVSNGRHWQNK